ncbi:MAG: hypothetical protein LUC31_02035 [Coprobacillus sp.]|nr:hypothetical protein [Coprobacillus sp.]
MANSVSVHNKWVQVVCGVLLAVVGIAVIVLAAIDVGSLDWIIGGLVGLVAVVYGLLLIISNIFAHKDTKFPMALATGSLIIAIGCVFGAVIPNVLGDSLTWFVGMVLALVGVCLIVRGIFLLIRKIKIGWFLLFLIGGAVIAAAGIVAIYGIYEDTWDWVHITIYCILGAIVLIAGCYLVWINCRKKKAA